MFQSELIIFGCFNTEVFFIIKTFEDDQLLIETRSGRRNVEDCVCWKLYLFMLIIYAQCVGNIKNNYTT